MEKTDYIFLFVTTLLALIIGLVTTNYMPAEGKDIPYYISLIGSLITLSALAFTIYQQFQLRSKSKLIEENTRDYEKSLRHNFYGWNLNRAISLTEKLEDLLPNNKNLPACLFIIKELQNIIADCKRANLVHYNKKLEECISCLGKNVSKSEIMKAIDTCKAECKTQWAEEFKKYNEQLSAENILITRKIGNSRNDFNKDRFLSKIVNLRTYLQEIKPDFLTLVKH